MCVGTVQGNDWVRHRKFGVAFPPSSGGEGVVRLVLTLFVGTRIKFLPPPGAMMTFPDQAFLPLWFLVHRSTPPPILSFPFAAAQFPHR